MSGLSFIQCPESSKLTQTFASMGVARGFPTSSERPGLQEYVQRNMYMHILGACMLPTCIYMLNGSLWFVSARKCMLLWPREILAPVQLLSGKLCSVRCSWEWKWNTKYVRWAVAVKGSHMACLASLFGTVSIQIHLMAYVRVNPILVESNVVKFQKGNMEIWREAWLKAERQLDRWDAGRLTKKPYKTSIWCSMASWLFCASTQVLSPRLTHRSPKRNHETWRRTKSSLESSSSRETLRTVPATEGWHCVRLGNFCVHWLSASMVQMGRCSPNSGCFQASGFCVSYQNWVLC